MATDTKFAPYEKCCRTCLKEDSLMFDLFVERIESSGSNIADMLISCSKLNIQKDDALPNHICRYCFKCLVAFSHFSAMAQKAEDKLKEAILLSNGLNQDQSQNEFFEIKIENFVYDNLSVESHEENNENDNIFDESKNSEQHDSNMLHNYSHQDEVKPEKSNCHEVKDYSCEECNEVFKKSSHLKRHKMIHSKQGPQLDSLNATTPEENVNTSKCEPKDQFQCDKCLLTFKKINSLSGHMKKHTEKGRILSCKECNKVFKKLSHLKRHEILHENNCPFKCSVCPKKCATKEALEEHVNKHREVKPHGCPMCNKRFSHLSKLTTHIKLHTSDKIFLCPACGKKLNSSGNLNQHMLRHTGLKEFACTRCPKRFVSKGELKSHTVTHSGERSYTCDQCGATFTKNSSLNKHKVRHLGLKPHQCKTCLICFSCKDHLKRHYRIHTGEKPYKCDMCERAFIQSNDLVKHRRSHLGDKVYKCPQCTESFRLNSELRKHIPEHYDVTSRKQTSDEPPIDGVGEEDVLITLASKTGTNHVDTQTNNSPEINEYDCKSKNLNLENEK